MEEHAVQEKIQLICDNINDYGLFRYDPRDIDDFTNEMENKKLAKLLSVALQLFEVFDPYLTRKIIQSKKRIYPTTYTFLAESQFIVGDILSISKSIDYLSECIECYYDSGGLWKFKENKSFFPIDTDKNASMPLYMLCRCNNLLARVGKEYNKKEWVALSRESADYMLKNHIITMYEDESESISYYYNSDDFTINVNTEVIDWLTQLTSITQTSIYIQHVKRIMKSIINEQNEDGSWFYFAKSTMEKYGLKGKVDCHHTATTLYNLLHVYEKGNFLLEEEKERLKKTIIRGMKFFVDNFFDENTGSGITVIGKKRKASTVQYSESLVALIEFLRVMKVEENWKKYGKLVRLLCDKVLQHVCNDGSAPGDMKIKKININNINWGNGVALFALCTYWKSEILQ